MGIDVRPAAPEDAEALLRTLFWAFGSHPSDDELHDDLSWIERDRLLGAHDGDRWVASAGAYSFELTVPGGAQVPVAGVTWVGVLPTHRRQGILRRMMEVQLDDVAARGEAVAVLTASEASIYGRFGYGLAARLAKVSVDTTGGLPMAAEPSAPGSLRLVADVEEQTALSQAVYDRVRRRRVGELSRPPAWWTMVAADRDDWRDGASARFCVVHEVDGEVDGFCWYRIKERWDEGRPRGEVVVVELAADDAEVEAAVLAYLAEIDLTTSVSVLGRPVDDPWALRLADSRRHRVHRVHDHLYVRILDVPAALVARRYEGAGALVLDVTDAFRPHGSGRYRLAVAEDGTATCEPVGDAVEPDVALDVSALGSLHLGDVAPSVLAAAGRLRPSSAAALRTADRIFPTATKPFCRTDF
jgi:predicted acetyltransferase